MNHIERPAWRNQWAAIIIMVILFLLSILSLLEINLSLFDINLSLIDINLNQPETLILPGMLSIPVLFFIGSFLFLLYILYKHYTWKYIISEDSVECHEGIIARNIKSVRIKDIRNVNLSQTIFQRIFRLGNIEFSSAGGSEVEVTFYSVSRPLKIKQKVDAIQDKIDG